VSYSCAQAGASVIAVGDLSNDDPGNVTLMASVDIKCLSNATWSVDVLSEYTCTPPCSVPTYNAANMIYTPASGTFQQSESIKVECADAHLVVSFDAFAARNDSNLLDEMPMTCGHNGRFYPDVTKHTCTRDCGDPYLDGTLMTFNWTDADATTIDTQVDYVCKAAARHIVSLKDPTVAAVQVLPVYCLFNGEWDVDVRTYGCTSERSLLFCLLDKITNFMLQSVLNPDCKESIPEASSSAALRNSTREPLARFSVILATCTLLR